MTIKLFKNLNLFQLPNTHSCNSLYTYGYAIAWWKMYATFQIRNKCFYSISIVNEQ